MIHHLTLQFPQTTSPLPTDIVQNLDGFFQMFQKILPCPICREHFSGTLQKTPPLKTMTTGLECGQWGVNAHNVVNRGLEKKTITYSEALPLYTTLDHGKVGVFLHMMFLTAIEGDVQHQKKLLEHLLALFPCSICKEALQKHLKQTYVDFQNCKTQADFMRWSAGLIMVYRVALKHAK